MKPNTIKHTLKSGGRVIGTAVAGLFVPEVARLLKGAGFDFFFLDTEHSVPGLETCLPIFKEARAVGIVPLIRVPDPLYHLIARALDAGALGLVVPRVETREQVERVVEAAKYPPQGRRGCALRGVAMDYADLSVADYVRRANEETMVVIQIESRAALERLDDLLSVPGVDAALIGPTDLSISLGLPGQSTHPLMIEAITTIIAACERHGVAPGAQQTNLDVQLDWIGLGLRLISYGSELAHLRYGAAWAAGRMRERIAALG